MTKISLELKEPLRWNKSIFHHFQRSFNCQKLSQTRECTFKLFWKSLYKKWSFPLRISTARVTKSAGNCRFSHIYWRYPSWKASLFVQWIQNYSHPPYIWNFCRLQFQNASACGGYGTCPLRKASHILWYITSKIMAY